MTAGIWVAFFQTSQQSRRANRQLNRLLHWTSRNIVLLPGHRRDSFLFRVKTFYSIGLMMSFAMWWYLELLPVQDYCEDSGAFFRAVPANFPTGSFLDIDDIATCKGYMEFVGSHPLLSLPFAACARVAERGPLGGCRRGYRRTGTTTTRRSAPRTSP